MRLRYQPVPRFASCSYYAICKRAGKTLTPPDALGTAAIGVIKIPWKPRPSGHILHEHRSVVLTDF